MIIKNVFTHLVQTSVDEISEMLVQTASLKLERIVSTGQSTPRGQWYDQDRDEWVILLSGSAGLLFEEEHNVRVLRPGDHFLIPAHVRHRVEWTEAGTETVWLALHFTS